ncbi:hypothetical protein GCM10009753_13730 [Streptantibioticus ferralitis]
MAYSAVAHGTRVRDEVIGPSSVIVPAAFFFLAFGPQLAELAFAHGTASAAPTLPCGRMLQRSVLA